MRLIAALLILLSVTVPISIVFPSRNLALKLSGRSVEKMILSFLRSSFRCDDLHIPARPTITSTQLLCYKKSAAGSISAVYKISLGNEQPRRAGGKALSSSAYSGSCNVNQVVQIEVFACVQKINRSEITRWKQIAAVDMQKKKQDGLEQKKVVKASLGAEDALKDYVKIAGFYPGYRYQVVVRGVDEQGRRSLFSQPTFIVPNRPSSESGKV